MKKTYLISFTLLLLLLVNNTFAQNTKNKEDEDSLHIDIGTQSEPISSELVLTLDTRFQQYKYGVKNKNDHYDRSIDSPKSVKFSKDGSKFYVQSLEGYTTSVYNTDSMKRVKVITHEFNNDNQYLFIDSTATIFGYEYAKQKENYNLFKGKPVESCFSHGGKYLWVTYYRRSFDRNAISPSAVAIIDTETDSIVRLMPTGPLPKMIACSDDNKYIAVTHWGDNTVGIINIDTDTVSNFEYISHVIIDYRAKNKMDANKKVDRDVGCGNCLRGTVFTPDNKYLLVGKMGGSGGIAVIRVSDFKYLGTIKGMKTNLRHLVIHNNELIISTNVSGYVQKANLAELLDAFMQSEQKKNFIFKNWKNRYVGVGARTIVVSSDGKYIFAAINNDCQVVAVRSQDMKIVAKVEADAYPVGMAISPDNTKLIVTSQGKKDKGGGNSVMIFNIEYK